MGGAERAERQRRKQALRGQGQAKPASDRQPHGKPAPDGKPASDGRSRGRSASDRQAHGKPGQGRQRAGRAKPASRPPVRGGRDRRGLVIGLAVVAALVAAIVGGVLWQRSRPAPAPAAATQVTAEFPVRLGDGVVVAGEDDAKLTVDIYEDFLCPACGSFERRDGGAIDNALTAGDVKVRYHVVNILDNLSNPPGYSTDAGNAALCAADAGKFPGYHASLYANQPREGGRGFTDDQLVKLGRDLGITGADFESCVRDGSHDADVRAQTESAEADQSVQRDYPDGRRAFATPTVVIDGRIIDIGDSAAWLTDAIAAAP